MTCKWHKADKLGMQHNLKVITWPAIFPDNPYDTADKWLLKENLPLSYRQQIVEFILQNTGQKDFNIDPTFCDPYTGCEYNMFSVLTFTVGNPL